MQPIHPGRIEVITGPMFSGKSEELIRRLKRARIARQRVASFKPSMDVRYHESAIASHSLQTLDAVPVTDVADLRTILLPRIDEFDVIGIDEVQFFDAGLLRLSLDLMHLGKRVVLAGLDTTFSGEPFAPVPDLMAIADDVTKLSAVCVQCGAPAIHTQRLTHSASLVLVGAAGTYEARCRACFQPYLEEPQQAELALPEAR